MIEKLSFIRKLPNGKYRVISHKGKNLGTYDSHSEAVERLHAVEYFKHKEKKSQETRIKLLKIIAEDIKELSYSSIMRDLNKNDKNNVEIFMKFFKKAFDDAILEELENPDKIALLTAMKKINYEN